MPASVRTPARAPRRRAAARGALPLLAALALPAACGEGSRAGSGAGGTEAPASIAAAPPAAVAPAAAPRPGVVDTVTLEAPADTASEDAALAAAGRVRRDGPALELPLDGGRTVRVVDDTVPGEGYARHAYLGRVAGLPFHLLRVSRIEGREYLLVHAATGRRLAVDAPPVASPDGARFVTASMDLSAEFDPTRLVVWRVAGDGAVREWAHEPVDWGPTDPRWLDARTIAFTRNEALDEPTRVRRRAATAVRVGERWTLRDR